MGVLTTELFGTSTSEDEAGYVFAGEAEMTDKEEAAPDQSSSKKSPLLVV